MHALAAVPQAMTFAIIGLSLVGVGLLRRPRR